MSKNLISFFLLVTLFSCNVAKHEKYIDFPENAGLNKKIKLISNLVPSEQQLQWQKLELTAFLHFGINTFTDREWGSGNEDPALFNPQKFNADQWVEILKKSGFKLLIITAKHHDGFCLWQTKTTSHSVASSPWKNGHGDVVRELSSACKKHGLKFGFYLSPWDMNASCYGTDEYNRFFMNQLRELLSNYGKVDEIWFDGACGEGPNGKKQIYDWNSYDSLIRNLQPDAVTAIMGSDIRWVGNESGLGRETEWTSILRVPAARSNAEFENKRLNINDQSSDLGSRSLIAQADEAFWQPSEVDVSIRPSWFYHQNEDSLLKSVSQLVDIYFKSVGRNSSLLLNVPPDRYGLISSFDSIRLLEFSDSLNKLFEYNYVTDFKSFKLSGGQSKIIELDSICEISIVCLQEDIEKGQRVEDFLVEAFVDNAWLKISQGTTIGYKRLLHFSPLETSKIRFTLLQSRSKVYIKNIGVY